MSYANGRKNHIRKITTVTRKVTTTVGFYDVNQYGEAMLVPDSSVLHTITRVRVITVDTWAEADNNG